MSSGSLLIAGGRIIDPSSRVDVVGDLLLVKGEVCWMCQAMPRDVRAPDRVLRAGGKLVCPGFIDVHVHLREPGFEEKETVATGTLAAARGGFTTVCCMPNTSPPIDSPEVVEYVTEKARSAGVVRVFPIGCITRGQKGDELVDIGALAEAGVVALSEDGWSVADAGLMRRALEWSRLVGLSITDHCEDAGLTRGGVMNEGVVSARLGLKGMPAEAETAMVARDIELARETGARLHIAHVSTASALDAICRAKQEGVDVTAEVTPHHLMLTEERVGEGDSLAKVNPPLRTALDTQALLRGLGDGSIDAVATDHAPHTVADKQCGFREAAFGISGLETAVAVLLGLVHQGELAVVTLVSKLSTGPARIFPRLQHLGTLAAGAPADVTIIDPEMEWTVEAEGFASRGRNNPWVGCTMRGKVVATIVQGNIVYLDSGLEVEEL